MFKTNLQRRVLFIHFNLRRCFTLPCISLIQSPCFGVFSVGRKIRKPRLNTSFYQNNLMWNCIKMKISGLLHQGRKKNKKKFKTRSNSAFTSRHFYFLLLKAQTTYNQIITNFQTFRMLEIFVTLLIVGFILRKRSKVDEIFWIKNYFKYQQL